MCSLVIRRVPIYMYVKIVYSCFVVVFSSSDKYGGLLFLTRCVKFIFDAGVQWCITLLQMCSLLSFRINCALLVDDYD